MIELENLFELGIKNHLNALNGTSLDLANWLGQLQDLNFEAFYKTGELYYFDARFKSNRNTLIVWLVIGSEIQYDLNRRSKYINLMDQLRFENFDAYLEFYSVYFTAVKYFFDGDLVQAELFNSKAYGMATAIGFSRGRARSLYQQAITHFDMEKSAEGFHYLEESLKICNQENLLRTKDRVLMKFHQQKDTPLLKPESILNKIDFLKMSIAEKNIFSARKSLVQAEIMRRQSRFHRHKYSLCFYRLQINILRKKTDCINRGIRNINDPILISRVYDFMIENNQHLTPAQISQNKIVKLKIKQFILSNKATVDHASLDPVYLKKIKTENIRNLLSILAKNNGAMNKEMIVKELFNYDYDPTIHDKPLYNLITRARNELQPDLILNHYGKYSLNTEKYKIVI